MEDPLRKRQRELDDVGLQERYDPGGVELRDDEFRLGMDDWMSADFPFTILPDVLDGLRVPMTTLMSN